MSQIDTSRDEINDTVELLQFEGYPLTAGLLDAVARERDEALAREAALREAVGGMLTWQETRPHSHPYDTWVAAKQAYDDTATVAAARDAALVEQGRRAGIKAAAATVRNRLPRWEEAEAYEKAILRLLDQPAAENGCGNG